MITSRHEEKVVFLSGITDQVLGSDGDLLRGPDGLEAGRDKADLHVKSGQHITKDAHRAHDLDIVRKKGSCE